MKYILKREMLVCYEKVLIEEEKSQATIEKYMRDVRKFFQYVEEMAEHKMFGDLDLYEKQKFFDKNRTGTLVLPDRSYKLEIFACIKTSANEDNIFIPQKWQKSTDGLLKYAEKSAKYIHQDTMKKIGTSKDFSQILAMSTCSSDYTDARTVILAVMKPYSPEK